MNRVIVLVDGFNLYHSLDCKPCYHKYKWLDISSLCRSFLSPTDTVVGMFYFTAYAYWRKDSYLRHKRFVSALEASGFKIVLGAFRKKYRICPLCNRDFLSSEEKRTDVNIAVKLFQSAMLDEWDKALIITADSDFIAAVEAVKTCFPLKRIELLIPIDRKAEELKSTVHGYSRIREIHLKSNQFPDIMTLPGKTLTRPSTWV